VKAAREELSAMREVFAFAAEAIEAEDRKAQGLLKQVAIRRLRRPTVPRLED
jgi:hypothetical protein